MMSYSNVNNFFFFLYHQSLLIYEAAAAAKSSSLALLAGEEEEEESSSSPKQLINFVANKYMLTMMRTFDLTTQPVSMRSVASKVYQLAAHIHDVYNIHIQSCISHNCLQEVFVVVVSCYVGCCCCEL